MLLFLFLRIFFGLFDLLAILYLFLLWLFEQLLDNSFHVSHSLDSIFLAPENLFTLLILLGLDRLKLRLGLVNP